MPIKRFGRANNTVHLIKKTELTDEGYIEAWEMGRKLTDAQLAGRIIVFSAIDAEATRTADIIAQLTDSAPPHISETLQKAGKYPYAVQRMSHLVKHLMRESGVEDRRLQPVLVTDPDLVGAFGGKTPFNPIDYGEIISDNMRTWINPAYDHHAEQRLLPELRSGALKT